MKQFRLTPNKRRRTTLVHRRMELTAKITPLLRALSQLAPFMIVQLHLHNHSAMLLCIYEWLGGHDESHSFYCI